MDNTDSYWAAMPIDQIGDQLVGKVDQYYEDMRTSGMFDLMRRSYREYYGLAADGTYRMIGDSGRSGSQGELVLLKANHYRNLIEHMLNLVTSSRASFEARAVNTDEQSQSQTIIASGILEYYMRTKRFEKHSKRCTEAALIFGAAWLRQVWNANAGEDYGADPESGQVVKEGDVEVTLLTPFDVVVDRTAPYEEQTWVITRVMRNKWDLVARYPDFQEQILASSQKWQKSGFVNDIAGRQMWKHRESDRVPTYELYHRKTDALPDGRLVQFLDSGQVLTDGPLPYDDLPLHRISAGDFLGTAFGYSSAWSILPLQQIIDMFSSIAATNFEAFGVQNVVREEGTDIAPVDIVGGLNLWTIPRGGTAPAGINLTTLPPEFLRYFEMWVQSMETISGVNSVARGNPEASLKSGAALALVQAQAIQFLNGLSQSHTEFLEDLGTGLIRILKAYAHTERIASIAGVNKRYALRSWTSQDLSNIDRVVVDSGNPLAKTLSGRMQLLEYYQNARLIKTPEQITQVITTGRLEPIYESDQAELLQIRAENEMLAAGPAVVPVGMDPMTGMPMLQVEGVPAVFTDAHHMHLKEHRSVLATPEARANPAVVQALLAHVQEHINLLRTVDPAILAAFGEQSLMMAPQMLDPSAGTGGMPQEPPANNNNGSSPADVLGPPNTMGQQPQMPQMPKNPMTGERVQAPGTAAA